jgi:catechol 2,3-dioxygenase-like lactoylglutathione lyase family enzyme
MEIGQFRVVLRARDFDLTNHFYAEVLSLPRLASWDSEQGQGALFQAGSGVIEVLGRPSLAAKGERDEAFDYQGPQHKLSLSLQVASAEQAYQEMIFRDKNVPGGLRQDPSGHLIFETHDPDGVRIQLREIG